MQCEVCKQEFSEGDLADIRLTVIKKDDSREPITKEAICWECISAFVTPISSAPDTELVVFSFTATKNAPHG